MQIIDFERASGFAGDGTRILARFSVQITHELRLCGLRLVDTPKGRRTFFPGVNGGGRSATASATLARRITETASAKFEGHDIADGKKSHYAA